MTANSGNINRLKEIDFMRPIVIVLLVVMHSFSIYTGGGSWDYPKGINPVSAYKWVQVVSYGCMLEAFTFISGYIFGLQLNKKPIKFLTLLGQKAKRLLIPSVVFSFLYILLFVDDKWDDGINTLYLIIRGYAHLWYLPMLFWCFIATWCIYRIKINEELKLFLVYACSIIAIIPLPLQINSAFHYLPFFYLGVYLYNNPLKDSSLRKAILYIIAFLILLITISYYRSTHEVLLAWQKVLFWYIKQLYATLGTIGLFIICKSISCRKELSEKWINFNACCFGIYIFHQFILQFLYYHSPVPQWCGSYLLPWFGFTVALFGAFGLTWVCRRSKLGKFLLG